MADVIAILNQKGGAGKSTLATNLARAYQLRGLRVLLADADPQATARTWREAGGEGVEGPPVVGADHDRLDEDLKDIGHAFDLVIIDGAPRMERRAAAALRAADLVVIPVHPSGADIWAVAPLAGLIRTRQEVTGGTPRTVFVVSRQVTGTILASEAADALHDYGFPVLEARTAQRIAYAEALGAGVSVLDLEPSGKAAEEINDLADEIQTLL